MSIDQILNEMDETLVDSTGLPFSGGKRLVDVEHIRDLMSEIKLSLPEEVRQAKAIVKDRTEIIENARKEADAIVRRAQDRAEMLVSESEVVKASEARAAEQLSAAAQQTKELRRQAKEYCEGVLRQAEDGLAKKARDLHDTRVNLGKLTGVE